MTKEHSTPAAERTKPPSPDSVKPRNRGGMNALLQRLEQAPQTLRPADIQQLQRSIGNRATGLLLQAK